MGAKVRASGIRYQYILGLDEPDWYERGLPLPVPYT